MLTPDISKIVPIIYSNIPYGLCDSTIAIENIPNSCNFNPFIFCEYIMFLENRGS